MSKPDYRIQLTGDILPHQLVACTGEQLALVLKVLTATHQTMNWYVADVIMTTDQIQWDIYSSTRPCLIGNTDTLISICGKIEQFSSGVFLGVNMNDHAISWAKEYETEDLAFEDNEFAAVEIRAFDTTYFEIYSSDIELLNKLVEQFNCLLEERQTD
jgi:hypothetical protein